ncbi:LytR family transcriptional regulator [Paenibacillus antri]|uniref:LytR family transcriptional regulator n=1 Tax=Paenibacillus antri TaxID=2582848 RepID=A0A5R9GDB0_9BACL|nr:LCP family protein [Paenibacillus antri]TLS51358.1 LytR family transcriptional regulator [Paenibacillus antri]
MTWLRTAAITIVVLTLGVIGYYGYSFYSFADDRPEDSRFKDFEEQKPSATSGTTNVEEVEYETPKWEGTDRVNVLLLGGDSRGLKKNEIPRSDTMMIASIDPVTKKAHLFSLLRDTYVRIPGHGSERINTAIVLGGPKLAMRAASELTGLNIQYYVYTDFEGFVHLIDEIGGIDFEVEKDMRYTSRADGPEYDIDLKAGMQHMDGRTALQYVRFRHDALSDFARTERQRNFMTAVAQKLQTTTSLLRLPRILAAIDPYIESNLSVTEMIKLGALGFEAKANEVAGVQLPPSNLLREESVGGASVLTVDPDDLQEFIAESFAKTAAPPVRDADPKDAALGGPDEGSDG